MRIYSDGRCTSEKALNMSKLVEYDPSTKAGVYYIDWPGFDVDEHIWVYPCGHLCRRPYLGVPVDTHRYSHRHCCLCLDTHPSALCAICLMREKEEIKK